jgi:hypothetical protein
VLTDPAPKTRQLVDESVTVPACSSSEHCDRTGWAYGTYETLTGPRQRYACIDPERPKATRYTASAMLARSAVEEDTCCEDCRVLTRRMPAPRRRRGA